MLANDTRADSWAIVICANFGAGLAFNEPAKAGSNVARYELNKGWHIGSKSMQETVGLSHGPSFWISAPETAP
jgi:hypothetical protein